MAESHTQKKYKGNNLKDFKNEKYKQLTSVKFETL